jgi:hypothetical protein
VNVSRLIEELFLEQWNVSIAYDRYYTQCAPKMCTYSYRTQADFIYMITFLISLCSGLQTILRFIIPFIVKYLIKKLSRTINNNTGVAANQNSIRNDFDNLFIFDKNLFLHFFLEKLTERLKGFFSKIKSWLMNLNLFESAKRSPEAIYHQRLSTKLYLCLLIGKMGY